MAKFWLDDYERTARLAPGLLVLAPLIVAAMGFGVPERTLATAGGGLLIAILGPMVLSKYVRERGLRLEKRLYASWDGPPSTALLRLPPGATPAVLAQRRANVERVTGVTLPVGHAPDPADDDQYQAAVLALRSKTTNHDDFPIVFAENKSYGFERNLLAVKPEGLAASVLSTVSLGGAAILVMENVTEFNLTSLLVAFGAAAAITFYWSLWPRASRVKDSGIRYAERLLDAAAKL